MTKYACAQHRLVDDPGAVEVAVRVAEALEEDHLQKVSAQLRQTLSILKFSVNPTKKSSDQASDSSSLH